MAENVLLNSRIKAYFSDFSQITLSSVTVAEQVTSLETLVRTIKILNDKTTNCSIHFSEFHTKEKGEWQKIRSDEEGNSKLTNPLHNWKLAFASLALLTENAAIP